MRRVAASSRRIRAGVVAALLGGLLALGAASAVAPAATAQRGSHATRGAAHRGKCAHRARRQHAHRARRCRVKRHEKTSAPVAPAAVPVTPTAAAAPPVAAAAPSLAAAPAPIIISSPPETKEAAPEGGEAEPPSIPHVQVSAVEYSFSLSRTSVPAGKVVLEFVNNGQDEHNLDLEAGEGPPTSAFANTPSKGVSTLELDMHPGSYTLFCTLPGHEAKGMKATLLVE
jgi:plastocyanin